ncbi:MAG TPA: BTAD domain-containing putative transcriptional regulator [Thermomicrobiales bacterium]
MDGANRSAREHVAEILSAQEDGDNEGAADRAAQGLAVFPDAAVFHRLRGIALFDLGANEEAKAHLAAALAVDPLDNAAIIALARLADAEADPYTAAEHVLTAWEHDPANPDLRAELTERLAALYGPEGYLQFTRPALAALYVRNIYPERAAREYRAILAEHPNRTDLRVAAALAQWRLGNLAETVEGCAALLAEQPNVVPARWALADATARLGNGDLAREHAKQAAALDPDGAIARVLIAGNPDAAIVDPDEPLRVLESGRARISLVAVAPPVASGAKEDAMTPEPDTTSPTDATEELAPKSDTMRLVETLSGLAAALAAAQAADADLDPSHEPSEVAAAYVTPPDADVETVADASPEPEFTLPGVAGLAEALAALDAPVDVPLEPSAPSLPNPLDVPYSEPEDEEALAETPMPAEDEPEPVIAVVDEDGAILTTQPGGEPSFDAADALPNPPAPFPLREGGEIQEDVPPGDMIAAMRARVRAGDIAGAVGGMRAALAAAGTDHDQLHAVLPGLRALVDATPERPDAHRLLGDAYARLGLYAQAQGQYRQALLVRIAGKRPSG